MKKITLFISVILISSITGFSQKPINRLTLEEVLQLAKDQSPQAVQAKHSFRASYWEYRTYRAELLPNLTLRGSLPAYSRGLETYTDNTGKNVIEYNSNQIEADLSLTQNIGFTGGRFTVNSSMNRTNEFGTRDTSYFISKPIISIGYSQPLFGFNSLKWKKRIEPLKYEEAKRNYIQELENISMQASRLFFDMILAQQNLKTAKLNYANTDTLYKIAQGRYNIGTIAENELLQMELSFLNAGSSVNDAEVDLQLKKLRIKSFLGLNEIYDLELVIPEQVPQLELKFDEVLTLSKSNNPLIIQYQRQLLEANQTVAQTRAQTGFSAKLDVNYGLSQSAADFSQIYKDPGEQQNVSVQVAIPILDWGKGRGQVKMAQSRREVIKATVDQAIIDFEQDVYLKVMQFNRQDDQVMISNKADIISQNRYNVTKERFLIGKIDVLDLNIAQTERDAAKQKYINTLSNFWQFYFNMRKLTLYDFEKNAPLNIEFELLLK
ncbi:MAG: TolC family protein [Tenuifilaceae bacterium]